MKKFNLPLTKTQIKSLTAGEIISISGKIYTARDMAHKRFATAVENNETLPINFDNATIYYCGPTPTLKGEVIGSCGPTTSARMDDYTPLTLKLGVKIMIGKGKRSDKVNSEIKRHSALYLVAIGGAGALYKNCVKSCNLVAYPDLGCEAVHELTVEDMQLLVATDSNGNSALK